MALSNRIVILSPLDLKPGATNPDGLIVEKATLYANETGAIVADVRYLDGSTDALMWPNGAGWKVPS